MKKKPFPKKICWILFLILGIISVPIGFLVGITGLKVWIIAILFWVVDAVWIILNIVFIGKIEKKSGSSFIDDGEIYRQILLETRKAVKRYTNTVTRGGQELYKRPWFLVCGASGSEKSSLLWNSGLNFPLCYPSQEAGFKVKDNDFVQWLFANEAVWIDTPCLMMEENGKNGWEALAAALKNVRSVNPINGIALVVDINEVINSDDRRIIEIARKLRRRIDELIHLWEIEFPVYLFFNRMDEIPGFNEYFGELYGECGNRIFGAVLPQYTEDNITGRLFIEKFEFLCKKLSDYRLDILHKAQNEKQKLMICGFTILFEGMEKKLSDFTAELFKPSIYHGKPAFRGFYFTSRAKSISQNDSSASIILSTSNTIANHPFNPYRDINLTSWKEITNDSQKSNRSEFVLPLLREIMPSDEIYVKTTERRAFKEKLLVNITFSIAITCGFLVIFYFIFGGVNTLRFIEKMKISSKIIPAEEISIETQYSVLDDIRKKIIILQKLEDKGVPLIMGIGFYRGKKPLDEMKKKYFVGLYHLIIVPAVRYLEYGINRSAELNGELVGEDYNNLYKILKTYLSISEAAPENNKDIDTGYIGSVLFEAAKQSILAVTGSSRLPAKVEMSIRENTGIYLYYLLRGEFPRNQISQYLVTSARKRLRRPPSAEALYNAVRSSLLSEAPRLSIDQIIKRNDEGILKSDVTISDIYTQEGWDRFVSDALTEAAENPFRTDWVIGVTKSDFPESVFDKSKFRHDMTKAYAADFKSQWLRFIKSIRIDGFGDLQNTSRILRNLSEEKSEISILLNALVELTSIKEHDEIRKAENQILPAASKLSGVSKKTNDFKQKVKQLTIESEKTSAFNENDFLFEQLRSFVLSNSALKGYGGYREKLVTLSEKLSSLENQEDDRLVEIINCKDGDPLFEGWKYTRNELSSMPEELAASLSGLLIQPFECTGAEISLLLSKILNDKWQSEIVKPYINEFSGRYPFSPDGTDASFIDVMEFFRPATGIFWSFYDRTLSSYIIKQSSGWKIKFPDYLRLEFNPEIVSVLENAERIGDVFFKSDGTLRTFELNIIPSIVNKNIAGLIVDGKKFTLIPGGTGAGFRWPFESNDHSISLDINAGNDFSEDISYEGEWGLMKMIQAAKINSIGGNTIKAQWRVNVQNIYAAYFDASIQFSSSNYHFTEQLFGCFKCLLQIIKNPGNGKISNRAY